MRLIGKNIVIAGGLAVMMAASAVSTYPKFTLAQDFRIETSVYVDEEPEPISQTLTLFSGGVVYDFFLSDSHEITVFDPKRERLILLDTKRQLKTTLSTTSILDFIAQMRNRLTEEQKKFLLAPSMQVTADDATGTITLDGERVRYRVQGVAPKFPQAAESYRQFADWYARLNAMRVGNLPPFARLQLNSALAEKSLIPIEIERNVVLKKTLSESEQTLRSRHSAVWSLSASDRSRIDAAGNYMAAFRPVTFTEFIGSEFQTAQSDK